MTILLPTISVILTQRYSLAPEVSRHTPPSRIIREHRSSWYQKKAFHPSSKAATNKDLLNDINNALSSIFISAFAIVASMKSLIIDTSGERLLLALSSHGVLTHESSTPSWQASALCATSLHSFLQESSTTLTSLDFIGVGIGPGSFLGTRIGVTLAQTLAYALEIPLIGFCSLQTCFPVSPSSFCVVIDAKSQGFYILKGIKTTETAYYSNDPSLCSEKELISLHEEERLQLITPMKETLIKKTPSLSPILVDVTPSLSYPCSYCHQAVTEANSQVKKPLAIHYLR